MTSGRQLDKLFDGVNDTLDDSHMWLAPLVLKTGLGGGMNELYIVFDSPISLSLLRVWNYAKTPTRGVQVCRQGNSPALVPPPVWLPRRYVFERVCAREHRVGRNLSSSCSRTNNHDSNGNHKTRHPATAALSVSLCTSTARMDLKPRTQKSVCVGNPCVLVPVGGLAEIAGLTAPAFRRNSNCSSMTCWSSKGICAQRRSPALRTRHGRW